MSDITITRRELLELWHGLPALSNLKGFKLGYAIARTKAKLRPEVEALDEALEPDAEFQVYEEKRLALCQKYVQEDGNGNPMIQTGQFVFGENRAKFDAEMAPLSEEYAQAIEDRKRQLEDYTAGLKDTITVEVHQVKLEDVPADVTVGQAEVLFKLIKEEE